ncbi:MAG: acyltransferase [Lachnospiraceae bacterium]|nr:acyltransferase [Lachnospiraceae bacterium]
MGESRFRNKITWFTYFYSVLVIWAHSYNGELFLGKTSRGFAVAGFESIFGGLLGQLAVPGFFLISAYLFYRNFDWNCWMRKWKSRARSILIPYLLWNGIYYLGYVIGSRLPFFGPIVGKGTVPFDVPAFLDAVLCHRYLYVFWYLEQLIFLVLLAPVLYPVLRRFWSGVLLLASVFAAVWMKVDLLLINEDALFYYCAGAFLALQGRQLEKPWRKERAVLGLLLMGAGGVSLSLTARYFLPGTTVLYRFLVPLGLWLAVDEGRLSKARGWMECSFFLYAVHFALVRLVNKTVAALAPPQVWLPVALYLLMPVLMTAVSYRLSAGIKKYTPVLWRVLNGGRG